MAGGSHNRKSSDSLKHVLESEGKLKLCKCPLHRNKGNGTMVPQTKFKRHTLAGVQGMCADGKTLIDSISHTLKRLQLLCVVDERKAFEILNSFDNKYDELINNIKAIINNTLKLKNTNKLSNNEFKLYLLTKLDEELKTNATGFYDIKLKPEDKIDFNKILQKKFTSVILNKMELCKAYKNKHSNIPCINKCKHGIFCGKHKNNSKPLRISPSSSMITGITICKPVTYNLYKVISQTVIYNNFLQLIKAQNV